MNSRIQLRRAKGWRKPDSTVVVARPGRWGNPFRVGVDGDRATCMLRFGLALAQGELPYTVDDVRRELGGHDLACWCPLDQPCHADVLLAVARSTPGDRSSLAWAEPGPPAELSSRLRRRPAETPAE
jgi:hypothetical protein